MKIKEKDLRRVIKNVIREKVPRQIQAAGTWTYIILTEWLCL